MMTSVGTSERFIATYKKHTPIDSKELASKAQVQSFVHRNWQIVSLRLHVAHRRCQDFFAYREIRPEEKSSKGLDKSINTKF